MRQIDWPDSRPSQLCCTVDTVTLGAWAGSRAIAGLLFDTSAADRLTFGATAFALAAVAALACMVPAIRATRIDPVIALRGN